MGLCLWSYLRFGPAKKELGVDSFQGGVHFRGGHQGSIRIEDVLLEPTKGGKEGGVGLRESKCLFNGSVDILRWRRRNKETKSVFHVKEMYLPEWKQEEVG